MRRLFSDGWNLCDCLIAGLVNVGYQLLDGAKILDYGCGAGGLVYAFRDVGYDAYGFDLHDFLSLRNAEDARFFRIMPNPITDPSNSLFDASQLRIPFEDDTFDLIVSTSTFEHVMDMGPVMAEIARVLKPDGVALHLYPDKRRFLVEPHMYIPLGARIQNWSWFYFWALLGVRNPFQTKLTARAAADSNMRYCREGLRYWTPNELYWHASKSFDFIQFATDRFHLGLKRMDEVKRICRALVSGDILAKLGEIPRLDCLVTAQKKRQLPQ